VGAEEKGGLTDYDNRHYLIKEETMPDGKTKLILNEKESGRIVERLVTG
jgi:hypothetical protein